MAIARHEPVAVGRSEAAGRAAEATRVLERFGRMPAALVGALVVIGFVLLAVLAPLVSPFDPLQPNWLAVRQPPSAAHWLGTDELGRDVLSRLIWGGRASLVAGVCSVLLALAVGVPLGLLAGYVGGLVDAAIARATDAMLAVPQLLLAIALATFLGASLVNATIAIGISTIPVFVRLTRAQTQGVMVEPFVEAARSVGNPHHRIVRRHVLPNIMPALIVQCSLSIAVAIIAEAGLSFLGLGRRPPEPSWGTMLQVGKDFISQAPWMVAAPAVCVSLVVLGFNLLGDGLRQSLDPRRH